MTLLTDGSEIYARTGGGQFFNLRAPAQPLLVVGTEPNLRELSAKVNSARRRKRRRPAKARAKAKKVEAD